MNNTSLLERCLHVLDKEIFDNTPEQAKLMEDLEAAIAEQKDPISHYARGFTDAIHRLKPTNSAHTGNLDADAALVMLDRMDVSADDDARVDAIAKTIRNLAEQAKPQEPSEWIDSIMSQAQVFASAWSLVGGGFDAGDMMEVAYQEKAELRDMLTRPQAREPMSDIEQELKTLRLLYNQSQEDVLEQGLIIKEMMGARRAEAHHGVPV